MKTTSNTNKCTTLLLFPTYLHTGAKKDSQSARNNPTMFAFAHGAHSALRSQPHLHISSLSYAPTPTHQYTTTHTRTYMHARTRTSFVGIGVATKISRIKNSARWIRTSPFFDENSSRVAQTMFSPAQWSKPNTFIAKSLICSAVLPCATYISYWVKC